MKKIDFSKFFLIEDDNILSTNDKVTIEYNNIQLPFYWSQGSTTNKFPYYSHVLAFRPVDGKEKTYDSNSPINIQSKHFYFYYKIIKEFCCKYKLNFKHVIRANINSTFFFDNYEYLDPHVDFSKNHLVILLYLNDVNVEDKRYNNTVIFDKQIDFSAEEEPYCYDLDFYKEKIPIKCEIKPKFGKIICFNGSYFHANRFPKPGENRLVCVFNLLV